MFSLDITKQAVSTHYKSSHVVVRESNPAIAVAASPFPLRHNQIGMGPANVGCYSQAAAAYAPPSSVARSRPPASRHNRAAAAPRTEPAAATAMRYAVTLRSALNSTPTPGSVRQSEQGVPQPRQPFAGRPDGLKGRDQPTSARQRGAARCVAPRARPGPCGSRRRRRPPAGCRRPGLYPAPAAREGA